MADTTNTTVKELGVEEVKASQFPSRHDAEGVEIAERTTDTDASSVEKYKKDFVLLKRDYVGGDKSAIHAANRNAVRQFLIGLGLRAYPDAEIKVSTKSHRDGASIILSYSVDVTPAAVADEPRLEHTRVDGEDPFEGEEFPEDDAETDELDPPQDDPNSGKPAS